MTAREAARRYSAIVERAAAGFATALLHHWMGHDPRRLLPHSGPATEPAIHSAGVKAAE